MKTHYYHHHTQNTLNKERRFFSAKKKKEQRSRFTYSSNEGSLRSAIKQNESKFSVEISHDLVCRVRPSVSQSPVSFNYNDYFICRLVQPILLFQKSNVFNVPLKQAKYIVYHSKQPAIDQTMMRDQYSDSSQPTGQGSDLTCK